MVALHKYGLLFINFFMSASVVTFTRFQNLDFNYFSLSFYNLPANLHVFLLVEQSICVVSGF
jgi:hypothetical protein